MFREASPLMDTLAEPPRPEGLLVICSPATFPEMPFKRLGSLAADTCSPSSSWDAYPKDFFSRLIPKAVTTTSLRPVALSSKVIETLVCPFIAISEVVNPI